MSSDGDKPNSSSAAPAYSDVPTAPEVRLAQPPTESDYWTQWNNLHGAPAFSLQPKAAQNDSRIWCLMLTLIIMCGAGILVAVIVAAIVFAASQGS